MPNTITCRKNPFTSEIYQVNDIEFFLDLIQNQEFESEARIIRKLQKTDKLYERKKNNLPHILWGIIPGPTNQKIDKEGYTGYIYFDFDEKDIKSDFSLDEVKDLVFELPFVKAVWKSIGGRGLGGTVYCPDLISFMDDSAYTQAYKKLSDFFEKNLNIKLKTDSQCCNSNRFNCISSDSNIYRREFPAHFNFTFIPEPTKSKTKIKNKLSNFIFDVEFAKNQLSNFNETIFENWIFCDKYHNPIPYAEKIYLSTEIELLRRLPKSIIKNQEIHDKNTELLAYSSEGFAGLKLDLSAGRYFGVGHRAKSIKKIMLGYLTIEKLTNGLVFDHNQIYTCVSILNSRCVLNHVKLDEQQKLKKSPLPDTELFEITNWIFDNFNAPDFFYKPEIKKELIGEGFENWFYENFPQTDEKKIECEGKGTISIKKNKKEWYFKGAKPILNQIKSEKKRLSIDDFIEKLISGGTERPISIINCLISEFGFEKKNAEKKYYDWKSRCKYPTSTTILKEEGYNRSQNREIAPSQKKNLEIIQEKYNLISENGNIPTQKELADNSGYSLRTIKKYWSQINKAHNSKTSIRGKKCTLENEPINNNNMRTNDYLAYQDEINALEMQTPKEKWIIKLKSHPQFNDLVKDHGEAYLNGIIDQIFAKKPDTKSKTPDLAMSYFRTWIERDYSKNTPVQQSSKPAKKYTDDNDRLAQQVLSHWMGGGMLKTIGLKNEHVYYALVKFKKHMKENDIDTNLLDPVVLNLPKMFPYEHLGCNTEQVFDLLVSGLEKFSVMNQ